MPLTHTAGPVRKRRRKAQPVRNTTACRHCKGVRLQRVKRWGFADAVLSCAGVYPYACLDCWCRSWRGRWEMFGLLAGAAALLATAAVCELSIYQTRHRKPPAYLSLGTSAPATDYSHVLHNS